MMQQANGMTRRGFLGAASAGMAGLTMAGGAQAAQSPLFRFGVVADVQYCDYETSGTRFYRNSVTKLEACVAELNRHDLAFVVQLGDFIDRDFASFDAVLPVYEGLNAPHYHVLGNHDFSVADAEKARVLAKLGLEKDFYTFARPGWRFIVLNGNDVSVHGTAADSVKRAAAEAWFARLKAAGAVNAQTWNGGLGDAQLAFVESALDQAAQAGERAMLFCHFPVFPANVHNLWNDASVVEMLDGRPAAAAYVNGHNHAGNYAAREGVHYWTVQGMVETADTTAYAIVDVYDDRLHVKGMGREPGRTLLLR